MAPRVFTTNSLAVAPAAAAKLAFGAKFASGSRISEVRILAGSPIYAAGEFYTSAMHKAHRKLVLSQALLDFRRAAGDSMRSPGRYATWFDANRDGVVCESEAKLGFVALAEKTGFATEGTAALAPSLPDWASERQPENTCHGSVRGTPSQKLYVSDCHRTHLLLRLRSNNFLRLLGGLALVGFGLYWFFSEFIGQAANLSQFRHFFR